jgi:hypothetical protein
MATALDRPVTERGSAPRRIPRPFTGWALHRAARLDASGARGLVCDLLTAGPLRRQSVFALLATADAERPASVLERLGAPMGDLGEQLRTRRARDLIAAAFDAAPDRVPRGVERALVSIGGEPLNEPGLYRSLFEILTIERLGPAARVLRHLDPITSTAIRAVDIVDPVLLHPEIIKHLHSLGDVTKANTVVGFLREVCSSATDEALRAAARQAAGSSGLDRLARRWVERADRFPTPPFPESGGVRPLTAAAEMIAVGRAFGNCLQTPSKVGEVLLGLCYHYVVRVGEPGAEPTEVVVEVTPVSSGAWVIGQVEGVKRRPLSTAAKTAAVRRMAALGAVIPSPAAPRPDAKVLQNALGVYRWGALDNLAQLEGEPDEDGA